MKRFDELGFYRFVLSPDISSSVFQFGEVVLTTGRKSNFKLEWGEVLSSKRHLDYIAKSVIAKTLDLGWQPQIFYGVPEGVTALGVITQYLWQGSEQIVVSRTKSSSERSSGYVSRPRGETVLLEDAVTTASSILRELDKAKAEQVQVEAVLALVDRKQLSDDCKTVKQILRARNVSYAYLLDAPRLLVGAYGLNLMSEETAEKIEAEYAHLAPGWLRGERK